MQRITSALIMTALVLVAGSHGAGAEALAPQRRTFTFHPVNKDLFQEAGMEQHCDFRVVGRWDVVGQETDYFDQRTGAPTKTVLFFRYVGTLSDPDAGTSVPDGGQDRYTITFAPDGSVARVLEEESVHDPLLPIHAHFELNADGSILSDVGHDDLSFNKHPFSIQPVCDALSP
jgi:hypothetical protein